MLEMVKFWGLTDVNFQTTFEHTRLRMDVVGWRLLLTSKQRDCSSSHWVSVINFPKAGAQTTLLRCRHTSYSSPLLRHKFCWPWGQSCRTRGCREVTSIPIRAAKLTEYLLHIPLNYTQACKKKSLISLTLTASVAGTTSCFSLKYYWFWQDC